MTDKFADVSVIIPAYRAAETIGRALRSVAGQTVTPREIVIVDDGSDDDTAKVARRYADLLAPSALRVVTQPNLGAGAARNRALAEATQPLVAFLDADDEWLPEKLERSVNEMNAGDYVLVRRKLAQCPGLRSVATPAGSA
jgi:teichuronic acid biosynthesis glycosyltransferase TuaG